MLRLLEQRKWAIDAREMMDGFYGKRASMWCHNSRGWVRVSTIACHVSYNRHFEVIRLLLDQGADVEAASKI